MHRAALVRVSARVTRPAASRLASCPLVTGGGGWERRRCLLDRRFRRVWDRERLPAIEAFDAGDDNDLDDLACHLLERFRRDGDIEAFALLFEVAGERLQQIAARLAARLQAGVAPGDLVAALKRR